MRAAVAHVHAFKNGISQRSAALNHSPAHAQHVVFQSIRVHVVLPVHPTRAGALDVRRGAKWSFCNSLIPKFPGPPFKQNGQRISETEPVLQSMGAFQQ